MGAGVYQVPAIKKAKQMGLETIVASFDVLKYPGSILADIAIEADTTNVKKIVRIAKKYKVDGVFTSGTDVALPALGKVNDVLHLNGPRFTACQLSTDKAKMKQEFIRHKVKTADFTSVANKRKGLQGARKIGFPVMVKAINSSGSRGISKAQNEADFSAAWAYAKKYSRSGDPIIVEQYLEGVEFGAQAFVYGGKISLICLHNDQVTAPPYSTPIGHSYPFFLPNVEKLARAEIEKAIKALKIDNSAVNVDLIKTNGGEVKVLEIGARMGATCLPELTAIFTGVDVTRECIKLSLGEKPDFKVAKHQPVAGVLLRAKKTGWVKKITIPKAVLRSSKVDHLSLDIGEGSRVNKFKIGTDRIGEVVVCAASAKQAIKEVKTIERSVKILIK